MSTSNIGRLMSSFWKSLISESAGLQMLNVEDRLVHRTLSVESSSLAMYPCDLDRFRRLGNRKNVLRFPSGRPDSPDMAGGDTLSSSGCIRLLPIVLIAILIAALIERLLADPTRKRCLSIEPALLVLLRCNWNSSSLSS